MKVLGPVSDAPETSLVELNGRYFRLHHSIIKAYFSKTNPAELPAEIEQPLLKLHIFANEPRTSGRISHIKFRSEVNASLLSLPFERIGIWLFRYPIVCTLFCLAAIFLQLILIWQPARQSAAYDIAFAYTLFIPLMIIHELGHLALARAFGCQAKVAGAGLIWWIFPAFYANVTEIWRLPQKQRLAVTIAGPAAQCLAGGALSIAGFLIPTIQPIAAFAVGINLFSVAMNLLPFSRLDGYWIWVDLTNTDKLAERSSALVKALIFNPIGALKIAGPSVTIFTIARCCFITINIILAITVLPHLLISAAVGGQGRHTLAVFLVGASIPIAIFISTKMLVLILSKARIYGQ